MTRPDMSEQWNAEMTSVAMRKTRAATPPPNDLPEEWHDTYDEPRYVRWPVWLFLATVAIWTSAALIGAIWGNV